VYESLKNIGPATSLAWEDGAEAQRFRISAEGCRRANPHDPGIPAAALYRYAGRFSPRVLWSTGRKTSKSSTSPAVPSRGPPQNLNCGPKTCEAPGRLRPRFLGYATTSSRTTTCARPDGGTPWHHRYIRYPWESRRQHPALQAAAVRPMHRISKHFRQRLQHYRPFSRSFGVWGVLTAGLQPRHRWTWLKQVMEAIP